MFGKHKTEVLVAGAGPVGLLAANFLHARGVKSQVYDQDWRPATRSYALALHPASLRLLDEIGIAQSIVQSGYAVHRIAFYEGPEHQVTLDLTKVGGPFPFLLVLPQAELEGTLEEHLKRNGIKVQWSHRVQNLHADDGHVDADIEKIDHVSLGYPFSQSESVITKTFTARADFVLGADGYNSRVRRVLDIDHTDYGDPIHLFVTEFEATTDAEPEVRVVFDKGSTNVLWPLGGRRHRWSFQIGPEETPDADQLEPFIRTRAPWSPALPERIHWSTRPSFEKRLVPRLGRGRIWLAGDAAHLTGPVGVQSLNVGLREAHDLAARMANVLRADAPMDTFEEYHRDRQTEWRKLLGLDATVMATEKATPWAAANKDRLIGCLPGSGADLESMLGQLGLKLA